MQMKSDFKFDNETEVRVIKGMQLTWERGGGGGRLNTNSNKHFL